MRHSEYNAHKGLRQSPTAWQPVRAPKPKQGSPVIAFAVLLVMFSPLIVWIALELRKWI